MLLPVRAIRGVDPAAWDLPGDFMFLALLLTGAGLAYELGARVPDRSAYRAAAVIALAAAFMNVWINLVVGIIGSEDNPANWMYAGVLAVAALGAILARFHPRGMARAMVAAVTAQALVFAVALVVSLRFTGPITAFFAALWLLSALLFHRAARGKVIADVAS